MTQQLLQPIDASKSPSTAIVSLVKGGIEEFTLLKVDFANRQFLFANDRSIAFERVKSLIIREPVFDSVSEYFAQAEDDELSQVMFHFALTFNDQEIREGTCVKCNKDKGLWHLFRVHDDHVFYIMLPETNVKKVYLSKPGKSGTENAFTGIDANVLKVNLSNIEIDSELVNQFPAEILEKFVALPLWREKNHLVIALADPMQHDALQTLSFICGQVIEPLQASEQQILSKLNQYSQSEEEIEALSEMPNIIETRQPEPLSSEKAERLGKQKAIVRMARSIFQQAIQVGASDIHMHPRKSHLDLLMRIDGDLVLMRKLNLSLHQALVSRIKILGRMNIAEHRVPQDGRIALNFKGHNLDMRLSIMPTIFGESVVIRLLDSEQTILGIAELGFSDQDVETLQHLLHSSYGMILVTGPTGSGKSTTLYAALQTLIDEGPHILTLEDPVEYQMDGVTQIPVNTKTGYTFARALRNVLRHDPDVIMVGEIRDAETAKIAVESALTGHVLLSTLHTNSAASTVTRLLEIGIEPYLLKDALIGIIAQRLVRKICPACKVEDDVSSSIRKSIGIQPEVKLYRGSGCEECHHTGVKGRMAVYELMQITDEIQSNIESSVDSSRLEQSAIKSGMRTISAHALQLAEQGLISAQEVYRVISHR